MLVEYDQNQHAFIVTDKSSGDTFKFTDLNGLHVYNYDSGESTSLVTSVEDKKGIYSAREVQAADKSIELASRLGNPPVSDLIRLINTGSVMNCPVTTKDIIRAEDIYGRNIATVTGATRNKKANTFDYEPTLHIKIRQGQVLDVDLIFINAIPFLISIASPLGLTQVSDLKGSRKGQRL
jgi:hypothetical protein